MKSVTVMMVVFAVFLAVVTIGLPIIGGDSTKSRLKAARARRAAMKDELDSKATKSVHLRDRMSKKSSIGKLVEQVKAEKLFNMAALKMKLQAAGWRNPETPTKVIAATFLLPLLLGGYAAFVLYKTPLGDDVSDMMHPVICAGAAVLGFFLPSILIKNATKKRALNLTKQFPDALDLMLVCVEAGLTVDQSFLRITEEIGDAIPELAEEFALTGAELSFLGDRRQAYDNLVARTSGNPEFRALATSLIQSEKYGTSVAQSLRVLSDESRKQRTNAVEKKAAGLGPKMTVPMIVFILPCLFFIVIGPAIISLNHPPPH
jgi:tight adherence protein C